MTLNIVEQIAKSVENRKKKKQEVDSAINLSHESNVKCNFSSDYSNYVDSTPIRLLDEGAILFEDGSVRDFIMKGSIERFYNSLPDDFVGYINLGHIDNYSLPLNLGTWTKADLSIVDIGEGRKGLDCTAHINKDLYIVKDLLAQEIPLSVSVEMFVDFDYEKTETFGFACVKDINIVGFSIVGNPANVSSSGIELASEVNDMNLEKIKQYLVGKTETEEEVAEETIEESVVEESVEETTEESVEETEETTEEVEETVEQLNDHSTEELSEQVILDSFIKKYEEIEKQFKELMADNDSLKAELQESKETIKDLQEKLADKQEQVELSETRIDDVIGKIEKLMNPSQPSGNKSTGAWGELD